MSDEISVTTFTHGMAEIEPGLRFHYATAGEGTRVIVLLHGFPNAFTEGLLRFLLDTREKVA